MTTATTPAHWTTVPSSFAGRIVNVVRLNVANPWTAIVWPWIILGIIFLGNYLIWALIFAAAPESARAEITDGMQFSGASSFFFVYMLVVAVQAINATFPFALGYGVTRRDFYLGSALTFVLLSAAYSVALTILSMLEDATGGWGLNGRMFTPIYIGDGPPIERMAIFFITFLFFFFIGAALASVYVRWRAPGMTIFFAVLGFLFIGASAIAVFTDAWAPIGAFFVGAGFLGGYAATLPVTAVAAVAGYLILRRATPRN